jgi:hypothetical protein
MGTKKIGKFYCLSLFNFFYLFIILPNGLGQNSLTGSFYPFTG